MPKMISIAALQNICEQALCRAGMNREHAKITVDVLSETDAYGTHSHGTKNLYNYIKKIREGGINIEAVPEVLRETPAIAVIDGKDAIGMVSAYQAMELAIQKASVCGVSCVTVRNGCHFGAAGYYANMAAKQGMIGISLSNVDANMTVPGAKGKVMGNNPLAYAVPAGKYHSVFLDITMSSVASLKVVQAKRDKSSIPDNWIVDADGLPTTDPSRYPEEGAMQPMSAHKGYGLAMMVELLTGVMSGGGIMKDVPSWLFCMPEKNNTSYTFIVLDVAQFMDLPEYVARVEDVVERLHSTPKAAGATRIYYPGEMEWERVIKAEESGITLPDDVVEQLELLGREFNLSINWA